MTNQPMITTNPFTLAFPFARDHWTWRQAVLPILLAIGAEVALMFAMSPYYMKLFLAQVPAEQQAVVINTNPLVLLSMIEAIVVPIAACLLYAAFATMAISAISFDRLAPVPFGSVLACAAWAYLPFIAKHAMQFAIVSRNGVESIETALDLQPATSFGALVGDPTSLWYHVADLFNPFDGLYLAIFVVLMTRYAGRTTSQAATGAVSAWLVIAALRITSSLVIG